MNEIERKRKGTWEDIAFPRITITNDQYSCMSGFESNNSSPRESARGEDSHRERHMGAGPEENNNVGMATPLMSPPPLYSANDYGIETICYTPKLVKSLMHRKVIRISSGGVHNICIVEAKPSCILKDVYKAFIEKKFTDVIFKGFHQT